MLKSELSYHSEEPLIVFTPVSLFIFQVLALVGDQLDYGDNICGAVLSVRFSEDILSVWNKNAADQKVCSLKLLLRITSFL